MNTNNLFPFDLEKAKAGSNVVTRNGMEVKFIAHVPEAQVDQRVVVLGGTGNLFVCHENGRTYSYDALVSPCDLFIKQNTIVIGDMEVPEPCMVLPKNGQPYWAATTGCKSATAGKWSGSEYEMRLFKWGLVHLTREAAELHLAAIIRVSGGVR